MNLLVYEIAVVNSDICSRKYYICINNVSSSCIRFLQIEFMIIFWICTKYNSFLINSPEQRSRTSGLRFTIQHILIQYQLKAIKLIRVIYYIWFKRVSTEFCNKRINQNHLKINHEHISPVATDHSEFAGTISKLYE